jgi:hypothetical protein
VATVGTVVVSDSGVASGSGLALELFNASLADMGSTIQPRPREQALFPAARLVPGDPVADLAAWRELFALYSSAPPAPFPIRIRRPEGMTDAEWGAAITAGLVVRDEPTDAEWTTIIASGLVAPSNPRTLAQYTQTVIVDHITGAGGIDYITPAEAYAFSLALAKYIALLQSIAAGAVTRATRLASLVDAHPGTPAATLQKIEDRRAGLTEYAG